MVAIIIYLNVNYLKETMRTPRAPDVDVSIQKHAMMLSHNINVI